MSHLYFFFFFNDTATTEIYTLSLHDALPICISHADCERVSQQLSVILDVEELVPGPGYILEISSPGDRKSTRLNSSHGYISYAVFCLKKKKKTKTVTHRASG